MDDEEITTQEPVSEAPDFTGVLPDTYKGEDGSWNVDGFKSDYDALAAFKAEQDERAASIPEGPDGYAWELPEDYSLPEGFDPAALATKNENGETVEFDVKSMLDADDPDLGVLQEALHDAGAPPALMPKLASILVGREIRSIQQEAQEAAAEMAKLGRDAEARKNELTRNVKALLPPEMASAVLDGVHSADALRGLSQLISKTSPVVSSAPQGKDFASMSADERIAAGLAQRQRG